MFFTTQGRKKPILPSKEGKAKIAAPTALNSSDTTAETEAPFKTAIIKKAATKKAAPTTDLNSSDTTAGTEATAAPTKATTKAATAAAITENDQIIYAPREMAIVAKNHQELNSCNIIL